LQDKAASQGTALPSQGAFSGAPPSVVPQEAPERTLPSQKQGSFGAPTMQVRGEQVMTPVSELPLPSLLAPYSRPRPTMFAPMIAPMFPACLPAPTGAAVS